MLKPIPLSDASHASDVPVRVPPHNFEAEQALLGAILLNNRAIERVSEFLRPEHFAEPLHGRIYQACLALAAKNQIASAITLKSWLGHDPDLIAQGGDGYLARLVGGAATIINALDYGRLVYDLHLRRELIALGEDIVNEAFEPEAAADARLQVESAEARLFDLATAGQAEGGFTPFRNTLINAVQQAEAAHKREGKLSGITTGLRDLDRKLGGLHRSDLIDPGRAPVHGQDRARHQYRLQRGARVPRRGDRGRRQAHHRRRPGRVLLAGNVVRAAGHPHHRRACRDSVA